MYEATPGGDATAANAQRTVEPADAGQRLVAGIADGFLILTFASLGTEVPFLGFSGFYWGIAAYLLAVDLPLTAWRGVSLGRLVTGVRVRRLSDGRPPGIARAAARIALVVLTGVVGLPAFVLVWYGQEQGERDPTWNQQRIWWDWAVDTVLVQSTGWKASTDLSAGELARLRERYHPLKPRRAKPVAPPPGAKTIWSDGTAMKVDDAFALQHWYLQYTSDRRSLARNDRWMAMQCLFQLAALRTLGVSKDGPLEDSVHQSIRESAPTEAGLIAVVEEVRGFDPASSSLLHLMPDNIDDQVKAAVVGNFRSNTAALANELDELLRYTDDPSSVLGASEAALAVMAESGQEKEEREAYLAILVMAGVYVVASAGVFAYWTFVRHNAPSFHSLLGALGYGFVILIALSILFTIIAFTPLGPKLGIK